jgi:hypothetical protein
LYWTSPRQFDFGLESLVPNPCGPRGEELFGADDGELERLVFGLCWLKGELLGEGMSRSVEGRDFFA